MAISGSRSARTAKLSKPTRRKCVQLVLQDVAQGTQLSSPAKTRAQ